MKQRKKRNDKRYGGQKSGGFSVNWPEWAVGAYLFMMLGVFPLYFRDGLFTLGDVKYNFFRTATVLLLAVLAIELTVIGLIGVCCFDGKPEDWFRSGFIWNGVRKRLKGLSVTDIGVLAYLVFALLSWILSENRTEGWIGAPYWYMGLLSQLLFGGIYFAVSRFGRYREWMLWTAAGSGGLVFLMAYLHRFSVDPFGLREGRFDLGYLGLIGNANFHSTYVCILLSVMMGLYVTVWKAQTREARLRRLLAAPVIFLGFCTAVTQNSDSIYAGMGVSFLFLLWFVLENGAAWKRYVEICLLAVSAAKVTGILQNAFPDRILLLNDLSFAVTKGRAGWPVLGVVLLIYGATCLLMKRSVKIGKPVYAAAGLVRSLVCVLPAGAAVCALVLMGLSVTGIFPREGSGWQERLAGLIWSWDNGRRIIWTLCAGAFAAYPPFRKLFGCGPDLLGYHLETCHGELVRTVWGDAVLRNAHNEWLNGLMNYGILGGGAYLFIFAAAVVRSVKNRERQPALLAVAAAVLAYMAHDFFCFQQTVCAPLIFILIGCAENLLQKNKKISQKG